jgi:hypothetical protein
MQGNRLKIRLIINILILTVICKTSLAQMDTVKLCQSLVEQAHAAYVAGNSHGVDSLYTNYLKFGCERRDTARLITMLGIISNQHRNAGFLKEYNVIQERIRQISVKKDVTYAENVPSYWYLSAERVAGTRFTSDKFQSYGFRVGYVNEEGTGFDVGISAHRLMLSAKETDNKTDEGLYKQDGYFFQANSQTDAIGISLYLNLLNPFMDEIKKGVVRGTVGGFIGPEFLVLRKTTVKNFYKEGNYRDSILNENTHMLTFNVTDLKDYEDNDYFKRTVVFRLTGGFQYRFFFCERLAVTLSVSVCTPLIPRLKINGTSDVYSKSDFASFGFAVSYIFSKGKISNSTSRRATGAR